MLYYMNYFTRIKHTFQCIQQQIWFTTWNETSVFKGNFSHNKCGPFRVKVRSLWNHSCLEGLINLPADGTWQQNPIYNVTEQPVVRWVRTNLMKDVGCFCASRSRAIAIVVKSLLDYLRQRVLQRLYGYLLSCYNINKGFKQFQLQN